MAHTSPLTGSRITDLADAPNGPQAFSNAVLDLEDNTIPRFSTASARDAAFSAWTAAGNSLSSGLTCFTQSDGRYWRYDTASSSWLYAGGNAPPIAACTPSAGWSTTAGQAPGVFRDASGLIHLVGQVSPNTSYNPQDGTNHSCLQLPSGYFPGAQVPAAIPLGNTFVSGYIDNTGLMKINGGTAASVPSGFGHPLVGITFHPGYAGSAPLS